MPSISLPKGGGAIKALGEKLAANPFSGTGSTAIPFPVSPARDLTPSLALAYGTGSGNGPFGLGWSLSVPAISRQTEQGLPTYLDYEDTFLLAGAEDLVPFLEEEQGQWVPRVRDEGGYRVHAYRPRVEGGFAKIERWVDLASGEVHWRSWSRDNVRSWFGRTASSRVADPADPGRVFAWLLDEVRDDRGNITVFEYKPEDLGGVDTVAPEERERLALVPAQAQRYLKRILYGNEAPDVAGDFLFEVLFDYGEHEEHGALAGAWPVRQDTFSSFRPGFDVRTRRLCRRILMLHHFAELPVDPYLVGALELTYDEGPAVTLLRKAIWRGYVYDEDAASYTSQAMPALELDYQPATLDETLHILDREDLEGVTGQLAGSFQLVDLDGEGLDGILYTDARVWLYKRSEGDGHFGPPVPVSPVPSLGRTSPRFMDLTGDGHRSVVSFDRPAPGSFDRVFEPCSSAAPGFAPYRAFRTLPAVDFDASNAQLIDLDGDGFPDLLVAEGQRFTWYPSLGSDGFGEPHIIQQPQDERAGPQLVWSNRDQALYFADMNGDGLADVVRVRNGGVVYWPSLGYGRFGRQIVMRDSPLFDHPGMFNTSRLRIGDVDGTGTTDLIYFGAEGASVYRNLSGNAFSERQLLTGIPPLDLMTHAEVADFLGKGTGALVWSTDAPHRQGAHVGYVDLFAAGKPYLLTASRNNMGLETRVAYAPSTRFYLADRAAGRPWKTRLAVPVHVIERVEVRDHVIGHTFVQTYRYHHGYFDGPEREFRGFGMVEVEDTESFADFNEPKLFPTGHQIVGGALHVPPVLTRTWFHTGADLGDSLSRCYADEYYSDKTVENPDGIAIDLPDSVFPEGLTPIERREALRSLRGRTLRVEIYARDGSPQETHPYSVVEANFAVRRLQPRAGDQCAVFFVHERESLSYHYERNPADPRVSQTAVLAVDAYGNPLRSVSIAYPRPDVQSAEDEQLRTSLVYTEVDVINVDADDQSYRLGVPYEARAYELTGLTGDPASPFTHAALTSHTQNATAIAYEDPPDGQIAEKRLLSRVQVRYYTDDLAGQLALGQCGRRALPYETLTLAFTQKQLDAVIGVTRLSGLSLATEGGYRSDNGLWWRSSGRVVFDPSKFYRVVEALDPFENATSFTYDGHGLLLEAATDPLGNVVMAHSDYRVLAHDLETDPNGNRRAVAFDALGLVVRLALMGKGGEGDTLEAPTSELFYGLGAWADEQKPVWVRTKVREEHGPGDTKLQESYVYIGGLGQVVQEKVQAEPGLAPKRDADGALVFEDGALVLADTSPALRWVGSGRTVLDNKGNPVKQYEPFFSSLPGYEDEQELVEWGVTPLIHYDPLGRVVRADLPGGTFLRVELTPWEQVSHDANDTVLASDWYAQRIALTPGIPFNDGEIYAATRAAGHAGTPTRTVLDHLGRPFLIVQHNGFDPNDAPLFIATRSVLDLEGNVLEVVNALGVWAARSMFAPGGLQLFTTSLEAGSRWMLPDAGGGLLRAWNSRDQTRRWRHDALRRPTHVYVRQGEDPERLSQVIVYGESLGANADATNHRGRVYRVYDSAGVLTQVEHDFKGNLLEQQRTFASDYTTRPDWSDLGNETDPLAPGYVETLAGLAAAFLETETFTTAWTFDALDRVVMQTTPDQSVTAHTFDAGGLLQSVSVNIRGAMAATAIVTEIEYDAHGRRTRIAYGNGTVSTSEYDPETFRVTRILTERPGFDPGQRTVQDLRYHHDPAGNIARIRDHAQQGVFFANAYVDPTQSFEYDPVYRLVQATGREHAVLKQPMWNEFEPISHPQDSQAQSEYAEEYVYDDVGNIREMKHAAGMTVWRRGYLYDLENHGNRLLKTNEPGDDADDPETYTAQYTYDVHGNMTKMPHLSELIWDEDDRLQRTDHGGGGVTYYVYDGGGQRVRKVRVNNNNLRKERLYFHAWETYREHKKVNLDLVLAFERETLHVHDDADRICLIETKVTENLLPVVDPASILRYQYGNHLGTATLELDENAEVISYEEFHPYGTSSYRAANSAIEVSSKRYRYTGEERDEETGLGYHGARYYAPWLARWISADPIGLAGGLCVFAYAGNNPVRLSDATGEAPTEKRLPSPAERNIEGQYEVGSAASVVALYELGYEPTPHTDNPKELSFEVVNGRLMARPHSKQDVDRIIDMLTALDKLSNPKSKGASETFGQKINEIRARTNPGDFDVTDLLPMRARDFLELHTEYLRRATPFHKARGPLKSDRATSRFSPDLINLLVEIEGKQRGKGMVAAWGANCHRFAGILLGLPMVKGNNEKDKVRTMRFRDPEPLYTASLEGKADAQFEVVTDPQPGDVAVFRARYGQTLPGLPPLKAGGIIHSAVIIRTGEAMDQMEVLEKRNPYQAISTRTVQQVIQDYQGVGGQVIFLRKRVPGAKK